MPAGVSLARERGLNKANRLLREEVSPHRAENSAMVTALISSQPEIRASRRLGTTRSREAPASYGVSPRPGSAKALSLLTRLNELIICQCGAGDHGRPKCRTSIPRTR